MWIIALVVVSAVVVAAFLFRRGRKVRIVETYRNNRNHLIWLHDTDLMPDHYYDGTLDSVWVPYKYTSITKGDSEFIPVVAVGIQDDRGRVSRKKISGKKYIQSIYIGL